MGQIGPLLSGLRLYWGDRGPHLCYRRSFCRTIGKILGKKRCEGVVPEGKNEECADDNLSRIKTTDSLCVLPPNISLVGSSVRRGFG